MSSTLLYTFRTNRHLHEFKRAGLDIFVFGKLKEDVGTFQKIIEKNKPRLIISVAEIRAQSRFETSAINAFGRNGKVNKAGKDSYALYTPANIFPKSKRPTRSLCNWTMYEIGELAQVQSINNSFIHSNARDLPEVFHFLKNGSAVGGLDSPSGKTLKYPCGA